MSRKRTVRRVWAPINPLTHAIYQAAKLTQEEWNTQVLPVQVAADRLSRGEFDAESWEPIFECVNRIESMLKLNRADGQGLIDQAKAMTVAVLDRKQSTGVQAFRAGELATLREIVSVYGDLLKEVTHAQFARACDHTNANIDRILRSKPKPVTACAPFSYAHPRAPH